jgi:hypothetical protein
VNRNKRSLGNVFSVHQNKVGEYGRVEKSIFTGNRTEISAEAVSAKLEKIPARHD